MERFREGGNVLLGMREQKERYSNSDMDFNDVFGGPPRRYSMPEVKMRYSFSSEALLGYADGEVDNSETSDDPWSVLLHEKPVFGAETLNRRRHANDAFFDDIFKGDETSSQSSPRRCDHLLSNPISRISSPARPLPPKAEPFTSSLPVQSSLPSKLTKALASSVLASDHSSPSKNDSGTSSPLISKASFSKFLNQAIRGKHETRGDRQVYHQSPLSREASIANKESPDLLKLGKQDNKSCENSEKAESPVDGSQFHFSIHKWAYEGIPVMMPLREGKSAKLEDKSTPEQCSSSSETNNQRASGNAEIESFETESKKHDKRSYREATVLQGPANEENLEVPNPKYSDGVHSYTEELQPSLNVDRCGIGTRAPTDVEQTGKAQMKPLHVLFTEKVEEQGYESSAEDRRGTKSVDISNEDEKDDARSSFRTLLNKNSGTGFPLTSRDIPPKPGVKGKVRDFVKIFSQETSARTKVSGKNRSQSSRWTGTGNYGMNGEVRFLNKTTENSGFSEVDSMPTAFCKEDENPIKDEVNQPSGTKTSNHGSSRYPDREEASSFSGSFDSKDIGGKTENFFRGSFSVEELCDHQDKGLQTSGDPEDIKDSSAKIQQWSKGRKGNIRSLLSTLQYVLWPESGWKPVPLVDIIEGSAVRRAYQKALLCLHPDKLQQKGAAAHHKYIAEKVFDILQDAWDQFNSVGAI